MHGVEKALSPVDPRKEGLAISKSCSWVHAPEVGFTR
jgi:hypothetical protein